MRQRKDDASETMDTGSVLYFFSYSFFFILFLF